MCLGYIRRVFGRVLAPDDGSRGLLRAAACIRCGPHGGWNPVRAMLKRVVVGFSFAHTRMGLGVIVLAQRDIWFGLSLLPCGGGVVVGSCRFLAPAPEFVAWHRAVWVPSAN